MKKNNIIKTEILDNGMNFEGITKIGGKTIFIPFGIKKEIVEIKILKINKSYAYGKIKRLIKESEYRIKPICQHYYRCGGCDAMHIEYEKTLDIKKSILINALMKKDIDISKTENIFGMGIPYNYRNKLQYQVRNINNKNIMGMFAKKSHNIIEINNCYIQDKILNKIANKICHFLLENNFTFLNESTKKGEIKNIMIRRGINSQEIMCVIIASKNIEKKLQKNNIINKIRELDDNISSIILNINEKDTNCILSEESVIMFGNKYIFDYLGDYKFYISTNSFFQVNITQTELLYNILKEKLNLKGDENVLELYSGVGSIGIFLSDSVKSVLGIEILKEAVENAKLNVNINNITNVKYICGDATEEISKIVKENFNFNVLVVDPPRKGLSQDGINNIIKLRPEKLAYISCNPATLARDLEVLKKDYEISSINIVDMFPWTRHIECICILEKNQNI